MSDNLLYYQSIAESLIKNDMRNKGDKSGKDKDIGIYQHMDDMGEMNWKRPAALAELTWLKDRPDPAPRNAEIAGVRAFSTMSPNVKVIRPANTQKDRERFSKIEDMLRYQYMLASNRPNNDMWLFGATPTEKLLRSAIRYGEIAAQVVHIDAQLQFMGDIKPARRRAMKQHGDFIINVHDPKNVHVRNSGLVTEGVLLKKQQTMAEFVAFWGEKALPLSKQYESAEDWDDLSVISYDYTDFDVRVVWASVSDSANASYSSFLSNLGGTEIMFEEHDMPFLNGWVVRGGVEPLNYAVYMTGAWDAAGVAETLAYSEQIVHAAAPRLKITSAMPENVDIDYTEPGNPMRLKPNETAEPMEPPQINDGHVLMGDRVRRDIKSMTVPSVVTDLSYPSDTSFAAFDQALQAGLGAYTPSKELVDRGLEEIFCNMLYWAKYTNKPMSAPYAVKSGRGNITYTMDNGPFVLDPDTYDYDLKTSVSLTPNETIDENQKITNATNMVQYLNYDVRRALDYIGEIDPEQIEKDRMAEELRKAALGKRLMRIQAQGEMEARAELAGIAGALPYFEDPQFAQIALQTLQQVIQQYEMQAQAETQRPTQGGEVPAANPENPEGLQGVGGSTVNNGAEAAQQAPRTNAMRNQQR